MPTHACVYLYMYILPESVPNGLIYFPFATLSPSRYLIWLSQQPSQVAIYNDYSWTDEKMDNERVWEISELVRGKESVWTHFFCRTHAHYSLIHPANLLWLLLAGQAGNRPWRPREESSSASAWCGEARPVPLPSLSMLCMPPGGRGREGWDRAFMLHQASKDKAGEGFKDPSTGILKHGFDTRPRQMKASPSE